MELAPIVLFVYNRPNHALKTLEALKKNKYADKSILHIYADGAKTNTTIDDLKKIEQVRKIIRREQWCKEVIIIEREENLGLADSVINGVTNVIEKYGKVIVLEDDIVTGKFFLKFMNEGLEIYKNENKVFGVSGYKYPSSLGVDRSTYFLPIASSWSFATWLDRWNQVSFDGEYLLEKINTHNLKSKMNFGGYPFYELLVNQIAGKSNSWAIKFYASMFLSENLFLYSNVSLVQNIGFDNSGVHCGEEDFFSAINVSNSQVVVKKQEVKLDRKIVKVFRESFMSENKNKSDLVNNLTKIIKKGLKIVFNIKFSN